MAVNFPVFPLRPSTFFGFFVKFFIIITLKILLIKNKVLVNNDLENAIRLHCNIKEKQLLIYHKYTLRDVFKLKKLKLKL